ncbi:MAG: IS4 family transposase [Vicinamibacteraceae bacterium]
MSTRSQTSKRASRRRGPAASDAGGGFLTAWANLVPDWMPQLPRRRGRKPRVPLDQILQALTFHVAEGAGTLAEHFFELFQEPLADSSWSDRRRRLPWDVFADLMRRALRPIATRRQHPDAFWRGWRVLALDGTQYSVSNTPQVTATTTKAASRRGRAAFAKLGVAVLLEVGVHNPLAAAIARHGESELALARRLFAQLPKHALLLADRLYGVPGVIGEVWATCRRVGSHLLFRVPRTIKARVRKKLPDGSRLVHLNVREKGRPWRIDGHLEIREIRVQVGRKGFRRHELRLCTSLLDHRAAPALDLARLYATRWEHELYFRNAKRVVRQTDVLQSHTVETGAQEIAAIILVTAMLARERARAANGQAPVLRIKFGVVLAIVRSMWFSLGPIQDLLTETQKAQIVKRGQALMRRALTGPRRSRTNPRAVRQPVTKWPRLMQTHSVEGPPQFRVV